METQTKILKSGLQVVYIPRPGTKLLNMGVYIAAGSMYEEGGKFPLGTAHFLEHMVFNGTQKYPDQDSVRGIITSDGGNEGAATSATHQFYDVATLSDYTEQALEYLSQLTLHPLLREEHIENEREIILSEFERNESNPIKRFMIKGLGPALYENEALGN